MANPGVVLLIVLAILIFIILTGLIIWGGIQSNAALQAANAVTLTNPCADTVNIDSLPQITATTPACFQQGLPTSLYYIGNLNSGTHYVVAPWTSSNVDVCSAFCTSYANGSCTGSESGGKSAQDNFDQCMAQLGVTGCVPPMPMAANGTALYYPFAPGCGVCDNYDPLTCQLVT